MGDQENTKALVHAFLQDISRDSQVGAVAIMVPRSLTHLEDQLAELGLVCKETVSLRWAILTPQFRKNIDKVSSTPTM